MKVFGIEQRVRVIQNATIRVYSLKQMTSEFIKYLTYNRKQYSNEDILIGILVPKYVKIRVVKNLPMCIDLILERQE